MTFVTVHLLSDAATRRRSLNSSPIFLPIEAGAGCQRALAASTAPVQLLGVHRRGWCGEAKTKIPQRATDDASSWRSRRDPGAGWAYRRPPKPLADDLRGTGQ